MMDPLIMNEERQAGQSTSNKYEVHIIVASIVSSFYLYYLG